MEYGSKRSKDSVQGMQRAKKMRAILLTILAAICGAGFIAGAILWAYHSDRFRPQ